MKRVLLLSRYKEDIDWVYQLQEATNNLFDVVIYNKSTEPITDNGSVQVINHKNVGREGETYLHYIIENYHSLPELVFFSQAYPFDHIDPDYYISRLLNFFSRTTDSQYFEWVSSVELTTNPDGSPHIYPTPHVNPNNARLDTVYKDLFGIELKDPYVYKPFGMFCASRQTILKRNVGFYQKLVAKLNYQEQELFDGIYKYNPYEGHILERLWGKIFE